MKAGSVRTTRMIVSWRRFRFPLRPLTANRKECQVKPGLGECDTIVAEAKQTGANLLMNEIHIGETYYILSRKKGPEKADSFIETILSGLPIRPAANDFEQVIAAARLKAEYPLSYADCFAVATAVREGATILTGDPEFKCVERVVHIE
jgi:uncharacterized protein